MNDTSMLGRAPAKLRQPARLSLGIALGICLAGCVLDADDRCSDNQVVWGDGERCVCAEGFAYTAEGCVACSVNEVASTAGCVCAEGFARPAPDQACVETPTGLGLTCSSDAECIDPMFPYCQESALGGYCTRTGCTSSSECEGGFACDTNATPSYCRRPPVGSGQSCESDADCAGTEALHCDTFATSTCIVRDCDLVAQNCFEGLQCCDLSAFGAPNLCIPACPA